MGLFKKETLSFLSVHVKGMNQGLSLELRTTDNQKEYNDFFEMERSLGKGRGYEVVFTIYFKDIVSISYKKPFLFGACTICFDVKNGDERLKDIKVEREYFDAKTMKKMIQVWEENR